MRSTAGRQLGLVMCLFLGLAGTAQAGTVSIRIDATLLTEQSFVIDSQGPARSTKDVHSVDLTPGLHHFVTSGNTAGPSTIPFTVTPGGTIEYEPENDMILGGRGSDTLAVIGVTIHVDAAALNYRSLSVDGIVSFSPTPVITLKLPPGRHEFLSSGNTAGPNYTYFTVTRSGVVDYGPENDAFMSGRGSNTLVLKGWGIDVDATALSYTHIAISGSDWLSPGQVIPRVFMPGNHDFNGPSNTAGYNYLYFKVTPDGRVDYGPEWDGILEGRGTRKLTVKGLRVTINARSIDHPMMSANGFGWRDSCEVLTLRLIPGLHDLNTPAANYSYVYFTLERSGILSYDPSMNPVLSGRGTATLLVRGAVILLDASKFQDDSVSVNNWKWLPARHILPLVLMPGSHDIRRSGTNVSYTFEVTSAGTVLSTDPNLEITGPGALRLLY